MVVETLVDTIMTHLPQYDKLKQNMHTPIYNLDTVQSIEETKITTYFHLTDVTKII